VSSGRHVHVRSVWEIPEAAASHNRRNASEPPRSVTIAVLQSLAAHDVSGLCRLPGGRPAVNASLCWFACPRVPNNAEQNRIYENLKTVKNPKITNKQTMLASALHVQDLSSDAPTSDKSVKDFNDKETCVVKRTRQAVRGLSVRLAELWLVCCGFQCAACCLPLAVLRLAVCGWLSGKKWQWVLAKS